MSIRIFFLGILIVMGCETYEQQVTPFTLTGNSVTYPLQTGDYWNVSGSVTFFEKQDGTAKVEIRLEGLPQGGAPLPAHLHLGDIATAQKEVSLHFQSVNMLNGISNTNSKIAYEDFKKMDACLKIHLSETGDGRNIMIAGANIGSASGKPSSTGRRGIAVCGE